ncbi:YEATS domain-containing protein 4 [Phlyctochytrium bullatum]|nr:YEATS domain-containing protein 4 [Phlyctochytrium bullatum]
MPCSTPLPAKREASIDVTHTHRWTVYVRGVDGEDLSYYIKKVSFKLHESFPNHNRVIEQHPFEVTETGWGEFEIMIRIFFHDASEKQIQLFHQLQLYPKDDPAAKRPITSEKYDEIVYVLQSWSQRMPNAPLMFGVALEEEEARKYMEANEVILKECEKLKERLRVADDDLKKITLETLIENALELEEIDVNLYRSSATQLWRPIRARGVFGGQIIGLSLAAATKTVPEHFLVHVPMPNVPGPDELSSNDELLKRILEDPATPQKFHRFLELRLAEVKSVLRASK